MNIQPLFMFELHDSNGYTVLVTASKINAVLNRGSSDGGAIISLDNGDKIIVTESVALVREHLGAAILVTSVTVY